MGQPKACMHKKGSEMRKQASRIKEEGKKKMKWKKLEMLMPPRCQLTCLAMVMIPKSQRMMAFLRPKFLRRTIC